MYNQKIVVVEIILELQTLFTEHLACRSLSVFLAHVAGKEWWNENTVGRCSTNVAILTTSIATSVLSQ